MARNMDLEGKTEKEISQIWFLRDFECNDPEIKILNNMERKSVV